MNVLKELENLKTEKIDEQNIDAWYKLFEYDSINKGLCIVDFYNLFFYDVYYKYGLNDRLINIALNYVVKFSDNENIYKIYFILLVNACDNRNYALAFTYIYNIKNDINTTPAFYAETLNFELNILITIKEYGNAINLIELANNDNKFLAGTQKQLFTFRYNSVIIYALAQNRDKCKFEMEKLHRIYYRKNKKINEILDFQVIVCNICLGLKPKTSARLYYDFLINHYKKSEYDLSLDMELFAVKKLVGILTDVELYNIIKFFVYNFNSNYHKVAFYDILFDTKNRFLTTKDMNDYIDSIKGFYKNYNNNYSKECMAINQYITINEEYQKINKIYMYDKLTGVYSRNELLSLENNEIKKDNLIMFFDIDYLKIFNDSYGHLAGDYYLKCFGELLLTTLNNDFDIYRYGGDEFVLISKETNQSLDGILDKLNKVSLDREFNDIKFKISYSYGTYLVKDDMILKYAIYEADKDMYLKKEKKKVLY